MGPLEASLYPLGALAENLHFADFLDIAIVSLFIYTAFVLFKQTRSLLIVVGVGIIALIYALSQIFHLYLTSIVLQSFFSVFLITLVVIFQDELRRFFELIAAVSTRQRKTTTFSGSKTIDEIARAVEFLAHQKIGALIVFRGKENMDRYIEGGVVLDGIISEDIIVDIFDPTSPGHDGAAIIQKDRIVSFGTHLPLSNNFKEIGKHGTRHSAALGISEHSDALALVVSEEYGTISVAEQGTLRTLAASEDVGGALQAFFQKKSPEQVEGTLKNMIKKNSLEKIAALGIGVLLWFFLAYRADTVRRDYRLPISYRNVPDLFVIENTRPRELTITLEGRGKSAFDDLDANSLGITVDASKIKAGTNTITLDEKMVEHPLNFRVVHTSPSAIQVVAQKVEPPPAKIPIRLERQKFH